MLRRSVRTKVMREIADIWREEKGAVCVCAVGGRVRLGLGRRLWSPPAVHTDWCGSVHLRAVNIARKVCVAKKTFHITSLFQCVMSIHVRKNA